MTQADLSNTPLGSSKVVTVGEGGKKEGAERRKSRGVPHERGREGLGAMGFVDMGEPNLACHPVGAVLPKAQRR